MSYTIDIYRKKIPEEKDFLFFATYVAFFPQLVAGPIERAGSLLPQIKNLQGSSGQQVREGFSLILWGYFLKVFIADNLSRVVDRSFAYVDFEKTAVELLLALLAFTLQIYGDFAGYSKIARGIAKLFGIELMLNFNHPYFARNPSEFWKRWHISLSTWLRDYLYISLGGNRFGNLITLRNLMITMLLGGLWHGAQWTFVVWGCYHGLLLAAHRLFCFLTGSSIKENAILRLGSRLLMFCCCVYGWLLFRSDSFEHFFAFQSILFTQWHLPSGEAMVKLLIDAYWVILFYFIVFFIDIIHERRGTEYLFSFHNVRDYGVAVIMIVLLLLLGGRSDTFIYFQF